MSYPSKNKNRSTRSTVALVALTVLVVVAIVLAAWALGGLIVWALWNWVAVALGASHISYWLGVGIYVSLATLASIFRVRQIQTKA